MALFNRSKKQAQEASTRQEADAAEHSEPAPSPVNETDAEQGNRPAVQQSAPDEERTYRKVRILPGAKGWGSGLVIQPQPGRDLIYSVTGGGIHPVAARIAELTGGRPFDGFKSKASFDEIAVAVIDCGGTARIGVYPMKGVPTVDVHGASPSGPLARFITEENFVSGVTPDSIELVED